MPLRVACSGEGGSREDAQRFVNEAGAVGMDRMPGFARTQLTDDALLGLDAFSHEEVVYLSSWVGEWMAGYWAPT